ncbi:transcription antitermination factor NusB [bacterium]|nr:transcription antitermination factor NusB [candidate division CSSED10-310 bacterium]
MKKKRASRELALQVLYALDIGDGIHLMDARVFSSTSADQILHLTGDTADATDTAAAIPSLSLLIVTGVFEHLTTIDGYIETASDNWTLRRLSIIDRNILRIAVFELAFVSETPPRVAINEAIEIAKSFGTDNSPKFINGVLDRIYRILSLKSRGEAEQMI